MRMFYKFLISIGLLFTSYISLAQNITTTIGSVSGCVGDTVVVPVQVTMATGISISAISFAIDYDTTKFRCISSVTSLNSSISNGFLNNCGFFSNLIPGSAPFTSTTRRQFRAAWFQLVPVAFNGVMFRMRFIVLASTTGSSPISWYIEPGTATEYADESADIIPNCTFVNGSITADGGSILTQPNGNTNIQAGGFTSFTVTATAGATFQWQSQVPGGNWINLNNIPPYSGVTTNNLQILNAPFDLDSTLFRVIVTGTGCPVFNIQFSNVLQLFVNFFQVPIVNTCLGDTVSVPIKNPIINGIANAFLTLQYNPDSLVYVGFSNLNPVLNGMSITGGVEVS